MDREFGKDGSPTVFSEQISSQLAAKLSPALEEKLYSLAEKRLFPSIQKSAELLFASMAKYQIESVQKCNLEKPSSQ